MFNSVVHIGTYFYNFLIHYLATCYSVTRDIKWLKMDSLKKAILPIKLL